MTKSTSTTSPKTSAQKPAKAKTACATKKTSCKKPTAKKQTTKKTIVPAPELTGRMMIYQVLPRLYGNKQTANVPSGSIKENGCGKMNDFTAAVLGRIRQFGYTHIWYTGLLEHATQTDYSQYGIATDHPAIVKGRAGSPYAIKDYYDIDPDLAVNVNNRMAEFEALLNRTHEAGLRLIMDFVPNHVARTYHSDAKPDNVRDLGEDDDTSRRFAPNNNFYYITSQPLCTANFCDKRFPEGPYKEYPAKATGNDQFTATPGVNDWYETIKLNYGLDYEGGRHPHFYPTPNTWTKMTDILLFWAGKGVDAFRCDMAEMVPCEFWAYAIAKVKEQYPQVQFIAEVYNPGEYRNYIHRGGFDYLYDKVGLYDTLRAVTRGEASAAAITGQWQSTDDIHDHMLNFLENHDEQRIASPFFAGNALHALPALVVSACMRTNPLMIYAGQEVGEPGMDAEGFSGQDGRTTIFDYWSVPSLRRLSMGESYLTDNERHIYDYYRRIISLCNTEAALREGAFFDLMYANYDHAHGLDPNLHYTFLRKAGKETILVAVNFGEFPASFGIRIPGHAFDHLKLRSGMYYATDLLTGEQQTIELKRDAATHVSLPARGAVLLKF